jgi:tetraacyldisaccharide 4'-kinase
MQNFRKLLFPFSLLYGVIILIRNKLYEQGILKSTSFNFPIISVGNLEVGGSGKTPATEYLINFLKDDFNLATLSRGYGRTSKGFRWVNITDNASLSGDEPLQLKKNYPSVGVAVCENRVKGIQQIKDNFNLVILDDAFQHRAVKPGFSILLFDYNRLGDTKMMLPTGNYRESFDGRKRADIIIVTKSPLNLNELERGSIIKSLKPFKHQSVLFSSIAYADELHPIFNESNTISITNVTPETDVLLLTGIAKPELLLAKIREKTSLINHHHYPDHHRFSQKNILKLVNDFKKIKSVNKIIITTQKDAMRIKDGFESELNGLPIYYWKIKMSFTHQDQLIFEEKIEHYVSKYKRIS